MAVPRQGWQSRARAPMQKLKPVPNVAVEMRMPTALEIKLPELCKPSVPEYGSVLSTASSCDFADLTQQLLAHGQRAQ